MQPGTDVHCSTRCCINIVMRGLEDKRFVAERMHAFDPMRESVEAMTPDAVTREFWRTDRSMLQGEFSLRRRGSPTVHARRG